MEVGKEELMSRKMMHRQAWEEATISQPFNMLCPFLFFKVAEAMEIMLIAVVSPVIRCEWQLENWQVALVTTVSACFLC